MTDIHILREGNNEALAAIGGSVMSAYAKPILAYQEALEAVPVVHTEREYELEDRLWKLLVANQQFILAMVEGNQPRAGDWLNTMKAFQRHWMENVESYLQHPRWDDPAVSDKLMVDSYTEDSHA